MARGAASSDAGRAAGGARRFSEVPSGRAQSRREAETRHLGRLGWRGACGMTAAKSPGNVDPASVHASLVQCTPRPELRVACSHAVVVQVSLCR